MVKLKNKFNVLCSYKHFYEIYCLVICLVSLITWAWIPTAGLTMLMMFISVMLFFTNDIKYVLPGILNFIFVNGNNFSSNKIPIGLIISGVLLVASLIIYVIKNKPKIRLGWFGIGFIALAVSSIIPIFWSILREYPENSFMYILYFGWLLYLIIYVLIITLVKVDLKKELSIGMSYMGLLIAFECIIQTLRVMDQFDSIFSIYYYLGWGLCNEAGIMMLVALPFVFYLISTEELKLKIGNSIKVLIFVVALILTTSRATYLVSLVELGLLMCVLIYKSNHKKILIGAVSIGIVGVVAFLLIEKTIINSLIDKVFSLGLGWNGREHLYDKAIVHFKESPLTIIFGDGMVNEFEIVTSANKGLEVGSLRMLVYHSTFFQTLATMGIVGIVLMFIHFIQKYWLLFKKKGLFATYMLIGFICVDVYGMIDNTYHMYYYMIVLVIILGIIENINCKEEVENE